MQRKHIPFQETGYFSKLICDYLDQKTAVRPLYNNFPDKKGFQNQIALKKNAFLQKVTYCFGQKFGAAIQGCFQDPN